METAPPKLPTRDSVTGDRQAVSNGATAGIPASLTLRLEVTDPDVIVELMRLPEGDERERYAMAALRLGVLSLRMASGQLDAAAVREAGQKLVSDVRELLSTRAAEMTGEVASALKQYFDPSSGALAQRIRALVEKDGEIERVLRAHLGPEESTLARTLASYLGDGSPIFKMLSPTDANGLRAQVAQTLEVALREQRERVLREFSLDNKESALCRLVSEITTSQGQLTHDLKGKIDTLAQEFSLDQPNSALSRLISRLEAAQKTITDQFSSDNQESALNRLSRLLQSTSDQIGRNLTLDDEQSALSRLKRELQGTIDELVRRNADFHSEVRETLARLQARKEEAARSTRHGATFEEQLGGVLSGEAQRLGDIHEATGATTGAIRNCKTGDYVTELGPDSPAAGARVVWEAKEDKSYSLRAALTEIEEARKNRQAQIGVFVFSMKTAPLDLEPFGRYGNDIVVVWDAEDAATDLRVRAAYSVARALAVRVRDEAVQTVEAVQEIELATRAVEKQLQYLDEFKTWGETVKGHGEKIADRAERMKKTLLTEIERLDRQVAALKTGSAAT